MRHDGFPNIRPDYHPIDVERLAGSFRIRHTLAEMGAARLWHLLKTEPFVATLGALTGNMAVQQVRAGLKAIYLSGWQVAADANSAGQMYPDQSLYPVDSVPSVVRKINAALLRADQIDHAEGKSERHWLAPILVDARSRASEALRRRHSLEVSQEAPRLQLLAVVQLEEASRRRDDRQVPARARSDGLQIPVRHARRIPRAQLRHVRARAHVQGPR